MSTFDEGKPDATYGSWMAASDATMGAGGHSTATIAVVEPGANGTKGALEVSGTVAAGSKYPFAGAWFTPGTHMMEPTNLSQHKEIRFWAKGDGHSYMLVVLSEQRSGQNAMPAMVSFAAGPEWKQYSFPFSTFQTDGSDITAIGFVSAQNPGPFRFELDEVEIR